MPPRRKLPKVIDVAKEPESIRDLYGLDDEATSTFGRQCLAARRMAEAGVRFIEVGFGGWDTYRNLREEITNQCISIDRPIAGLLTDLAQRGLLEDTLVIWGGEFGRTPDAQGTDGRNHNNKGFFHVDGWRWGTRWHGLRRDRSYGSRGGGWADPHSRSAYHHFAHAWFEPRTLDLRARGPRLPTDGCPW